MCADLQMLHCLDLKLIPAEKQFIASAVTAGEKGTLNKDNIWL